MLVDVSSLTTDVLLEIDRHVIKDVWWQWPVGDAQHINLAELDAMLKGINIALQWGIRGLRLFMDTTCVHWWVSDMLTGKSQNVYEGSKQDADLKTAHAWKVGLSVQIISDHDVSDVKSELSRQAHRSIATMVLCDPEGDWTGITYICFDGEWKRSD